MGIMWFYEVLRWVYSFWLSKEIRLRLNHVDTRKPGDPFGPAEDYLESVFGRVNFMRLFNDRTWLFYMEHGMAIVFPVIIFVIVTIGLASGTVDGNHYEDIPGDVFSDQLF